MKHCDEYIHDFRSPMPLRWWLFVNRLPAADQILCWENGVKPELYADYYGFGSKTRIKMIMASCHGDVGISPNLKAEVYDHRVPIEELSNFGEFP